MKTTFGQPDPPRLRLSEAKGDDRVLLRWDPPLVPQGVITHYMISYVVIPDSLAGTNIDACAAAGK